jgi:uncharacterized coiled-coil protein SlyX
MTTDELDALEKFIDKARECFEIKIPDLAIAENALASLRRQLAEVITERDQARMDLTNERAKKSDDTFDAYNDLASANKAIDSLQSQLTAERERADKAEAEFDRLSERMRARLVEYGAKTDAALAEARELRAIVSKCAEALSNGAAISPDCTIEFMQSLPSEIGLHVASLVEDRDQWKENAAAAQAEARELRELLDSARTHVRAAEKNGAESASELLARIDAKLTEGA